jgi:branched-chain amino acid aminotransferase
MKTWIDGAVCDTADAKVPVKDHGLLYGDGVFEGLRIHRGGVFRLDAHLDRLEASARAIGLALPERARFREILSMTWRATGLADAYVRLIVTRGEGPLGVDPGRCPTPRVVCIVEELDLYPAATLERGLDLLTVSTRRDPAGAVDPRVKSLNYLGSVLAKREAVTRGADEALLLNTQGAIAEAAVANVFLSRQGELLTPPTSDGALAGITRDSVLRLARELGLPVHERSVGRLDLLDADEAFLTGTGARIVPVRSLDGQTLRRVPGPFTEKLRQAYLEAVPRETSPL